MTKKNNFNLTLFSDLDLEGMAVEVCFKNQTIASVNYENGVENIEIEFFSKCGELLEKKFNLQDMIDILEAAKQLAIKCAKEDEQKKQSGEWI